jgi:hypothetical protein
MQQQQVRHWGKAGLPDNAQAVPDTPAGQLRIFDHWQFAHAACSILVFNTEQQFCQAFSVPAPIARLGDEGTL